MLLGRLLLIQSVRLALRDLGFFELVRSQILSILARSLIVQIYGITRLHVLEIRKLQRCYLIRGKTSKKFLQITVKVILIVLKEFVELGSRV